MRIQQRIYGYYRGSDGNQLYMDTILIYILM